MEDHVDDLAELLLLNRLLERLFGDVFGDVGARRDELTLNILLRGIGVVAVDVDEIIREDLVENDFADGKGSNTYWPHRAARNPCGDHRQRSYGGSWRGSRCGYGARNVVS